MSNVPIEDESWSDLAAELGLETGPGAPPPPPRREEPPADEPDPELDVAGNGEPDAPDSEADDTEVIPALSGEPVAEGSADEPGPRRRRRRRRRKKKGGAAEPTDAGAAAAEDDEAEAADEDEAGEVADGFEEPTAEIARDVIANWNVPSWEQIIAGLYRPDR
jgi:ribonuclease E